MGDKWVVGALVMGFFVVGLIIVLNVRGCISTIHQESTEEIRVSSYGATGRIEIVMIDGCRYLVLLGDNKGGIAAAVNQPAACK